MPPWLPGLLIALVAIIPVLWGEVRQRKKSAAEVDNLAVQSYKALGLDLRQQLDEEQQGRRILSEEIKNEKETSSLLYQQNMALMGHNLALTAKLATALNVDVLNSKSASEK